MRLVLVIDDDTLECRFVSSIMAADGLNVLQTSRFIEGIVWVERYEPGVVMVSERIEGYDAGDVVSIMRRMTSRPLVVIGEGDVPDELQNLKRGADFYLRRPFSSAELLVRVRRFLRTSGAVENDANPGDTTKGHIRVVREESASQNEPEEKTVRNELAS